MKTTTRWILTFPRHLQTVPWNRMLRERFDLDLEVVAGKTSEDSARLGYEVTGERRALDDAVEFLRGHGITVAQDPRE